MYLVNNLYYSQSHNIIQRAFRILTKLSFKKVIFFLLTFYKATERTKTFRSPVTHCTVDWKLHFSRVDV